MIIHSKIRKLILLRLVGKAMGGRLQSQKIIFDTLLPIAEDRCHERDLKAAGQAVPHHVSSTSPYALLLFICPKTRSRLI